MDKINHTFMEVKNLSISFQVSGHQLKVVNNISFDLLPGKITAIVGQSGSGKSVTALSIMKLLAHNATISGQVIFDKMDLLTLSEDSLTKIRGKDIGMIFQDPVSSLNPLHTIRKQISEAISIHYKFSSKQVGQRVNELLDLVDLKNFTDRLDSYPHQLSGGQRQRVMIAIALANNPKLLIADEPTTALDVATQNEILKLLLDLRDKLNLTILFITHNLRLVKILADNVLVMNRGEIYERGSVDNIFTNPQHQYTKSLISALSSNLKEPVSAKGQYHNSKIILEVKNLTVTFPLRKNFFGIVKQYLKANNNISFDLKQGKTLGIIGGSGSGKSTLAFAIANLIESSGDVIIDEVNIKNLNKSQKNNLRKKIQIIFQDPYSSLNPRMKISKIIEEGLIIHHLPIEDKVNKILVEVGLNVKMADYYPHQLSGGQRQRVAIARSLILNPEILILDEPTSSLDLITQDEILKLLNQLQKNYKISYIFISHDLDVIRSVSNNIMVMKDGMIAEFGSAKQIIQDPKENYTKKLIEIFIN